MFLCPSLVLLGLKPKNRRCGLRLPRLVAPGLWEPCWEEVQQDLALGWFDKDLLENARDLESLLLLPSGRHLGKVLTTAGKILFVLKLLIPGVCQESWVAETVEPPPPCECGERGNLGKELVGEPGGRCHFGTKEVWEQGRCPAVPPWCVCVSAALSQNTAGR